MKLITVYVRGLVHPNLGVIDSITNFWKISKLAHAEYTSNIKFLFYHYWITKMWDVINETAMNTYYLAYEASLDQVWKNQCTNTYNNTYNLEFLFCDIETLKKIHY